MMYTEEQIKKNRAEWCEALRSGNYGQTTECLRDNDGYCCWGVAADLAVANAWTEINMGVYTHPLQAASVNFALSQMPNEELRARVGMSTAAADYLAQANDEGMTFANIAVEIEALPITLGAA